MINYISTRGPGEPKSFEDVLLSGLAPDGGLYIPSSWPVIDPALLDHLKGAPYSTVAAQIMMPFVEGSINKEEFQSIVSQTYDGTEFSHKGVAPLRQLGPNAWLLELYQGPTLSFKDYALQLLGRLFDYVLEKQNKRITIIGATSGDTGSAAIEACKNCKNVDVFILHPQGRTSEIQRRQMTCVKSDNIHNIALEGNFDDCQSIIKAMFSDASLNKELNLSAINSINWARIMAQIVYYMYSSIALGVPQREVSFVVPTGNFGNIYAAWAAKKIGLPIRDLVIASNRNDILTRFFESGQMKKEGVVPSLSPSMDIQISSNFERFLCDIMDRDHGALFNLMNDFANEGSFELGDNLMKKVSEQFFSYRCSDVQTIDAIKNCYEETGIIIDPHTAVALHGAFQHKGDPSIPLVLVGTADPSKFPDAVKQAVGKTPELPERLKNIMELEEHYKTLPNNFQQVKAFVKDYARK
jgi:threonine synthase